MKYLKKRRILFKLIVALCIGFSVFNFYGNNMRVMALSDTEQKEHQNKHNNEKPSKTEPGKSNNGDQVTTIYTYSDGCKKTETKLDASVTGQATTTITWQYSDGTTSSTAGSGTSETVEKANEDNAEHAEAMQGGKLLTPIMDLLMTIGDGIMDILQKAILGTSAHISVDLSTNLLSVVIGILAALAVVALVVVATGGLAAWVAGIGGVLGSALTAIGSTGLVTTIITAGTLVGALAAYNYAASGFSAAFLPDITVFPTYAIGPEEIFEGKLLIFDVNFFSPKELRVTTKSGDKKLAEDYNADTDGDVDYYYYLDGTEEVITSKQNTALSLSKVIAKWYYSIRNLALVVMMIILVYIGIRMLFCSIASEKSKYKKMLVDWLVSMCLVFLLHYIMVFAVSINEEVVKLVDSYKDKNKYAIMLGDLKNRDEFIKTVEKDDDLKKGLADSAGNALYDESGQRTGAGDAEMFLWPTNLVGKIRMEAQMQNGSSEYVGYALAFLVLVFYTLFFTFTYLKRVLYLAFLTVIAPLVAMTYSIDKIADGKAQAFNMWLKEYIFNLLIQPVHLLLYLLLISMAFDLSGQNIIYTLVAIGFMMPAEKLIRSMFGINKATTPGFLGGATGAALTMSALQKLNKFAGRGPGGKGPSGEKAPKLKTNENDPEGIYNRSADSGKNMAELLSGDDEEKNNNINSNGPSAADANLIDGEDPVKRMEKESLEEQIAEGLINPEDLTDSQKDLLGTRAMDETEEIGTSQNDSKLGKLQTLVNRAKDRGNAFKRISGDNLRREFGSKEAWKNKIKVASTKTLQGGARLTGTVLGAGIGAAAGIAAGDPNAIMKNTAMGAVAGESLGTGLVNKVDNFGGKYQEAKNEYEKDRYGDQYSKIKKAKQDEKFIKDTEARRHYAREFSSELKDLSGKEKQKKLDEIMKQAVKYREYGVTDNSLITKAMKLDRSDKTSNTSIAAAMMANKAKDLDGLSKYQEKLSKQVGVEKAKDIATDAAKIGGISI